MLKTILGLAPQQEEDGSYFPSKLALKLTTSDKTSYSEVSYVNPQGSGKKILVICTETKNLKTQSGKFFSTGNHPVELFVPLLHLKSAGFEPEFVTPTGRPVILEMWAFPKQDKNVLAIYQEYLEKLEAPLSLKQCMELMMTTPEQYGAVFIPGGHGAMLDLPESETLGNILHWADNNQLFTISICHGPAALLATSLHNGEFLYRGRSMAVFPDSVDNISPMLGYLPGKLLWNLEMELKNAGVNIVNTKADETVCVDGKLISGASPKAANPLGKLAAECLLQAFN